MIKKIEQFLQIMLVLTAVLLLLATAARTPGTPVAGTETTAPESPETTGAVQAEFGGADRVTVFLDEGDGDSISRCVYAVDLNADAGTQGGGSEAMGYALAKRCGTRQTNPIADFWDVVEEGLFEKTEDASGKLETAAFRAPGLEKQTYPYTAEGARALLTDLLTGAAEVDDGLDIEKKLLGTSGAVAADQIAEAPGDCYYAYFICYGDRTAHLLCFYLRGNETIDDVEFQLLNLRYAAGNAESLSRMDQRGDRQAAALMAAAEQLMTGKGQAGQGQISFTYTLENCDAAIERYTFTGGAETGCLTNYRIRVNG